MTFHIFRTHCAQTIVWTVLLKHSDCPQAQWLCSDHSVVLVPYEYNIKSYLTTAVLQIQFLHVHVSVLFYSYNTSYLCHLYQNDIVQHVINHQLRSDHMIRLLIRRQGTYDQDNKHTPKYSNTFYVQQDPLLILFLYSPYPSAPIYTHLWPYTSVYMYFFMRT